MGAYQEMKHAIQGGVDEGIAQSLGEGESHKITDAVAVELLCVSPSNEQMGWLIFGGEVRAVRKVGNIAPDIWHVHTRKDN